IATLRPRLIPPERSRRKADHVLPPFIDPTADAHRLLASHLSVAGTDPLASSAEAVARATVEGSAVAITGDDPAVSALVAANIAAASAHESRGTLLVDGDVEHHAVAQVLRMSPAPGLTYVLSRRSTRTQATMPVAVGRDRR